MNDKERKINIYNSSLFAITLIILATFLVYSNIFKNEFMYDDMGNIVKCDLIRSWKNIPKIFTKDYFVLAFERTYRPVSTISYFLDYSLWEYNVAGWHLTNVLMQAINGSLVFFLSCKLSKHRLASLFTGLLFTVHPIQTEVVNGISFREDLISFLFFILALLLYVEYKNRIKNNLKSESLKLYFASCLCYIVALFAKEMASTLPAIIVLINYCFYRGKNKESYLEVLGYFAIAFLFLLVTRIIFIPAGYIGEVDISQTAYYPGGTIITAMMTFSRVVAYYMKLLILPVKLCLDYSNMLLTFHIDYVVIITALIILAMLVFAIARVNKNPIITFCIIYFFITLLPVSNIIPLGNIMSERYLYFSSFGFCFLLSLSVLSLNNKNMHIAGVWILSLVILLYGIRTYIRNYDWKNDLIMAENIVSCNPQSYMSWTILGNAYGERKDYSKSLEAYKKAITLNPSNAKTYYNLGALCFEMKNYKEAISRYKKAIDIFPSYSDAYNDLGYTYFKMGDNKNAIAEFETAIRLNPVLLRAYNNLGIAYLNMGQLNKAADAFKSALKINLMEKGIYNNLGTIYAQKKEFADAIDAYKKELQIDASNLNANYNLANVFYINENYKEAMKYYRNVIKIDPNSTLAEDSKDKIEIFNRPQTINNGK